MTRMTTRLIFRQMIHQRGREGSPYYVSLHSDDESGTDEDSIALQTIKRSTSGRKIEVINVQVKPEDSLQALALRYRCTVSGKCDLSTNKSLSIGKFFLYGWMKFQISELKRINKIDKENEIYARPYIKIPVQPFSILTETLPEDNQGDVVAQCQEESIMRKEAQLIDLDIANAEPSNKEINTIILNSVCEPLSSYNSANLMELSHTEHDRLLSDTERTKVMEPCEPDMFKCSGDTWGLSWTQLLVVSLLLGFAGPIIYILYIAEYSFKANATTSD